MHTPTTNPEPLSLSVRKAGSIGSRSVPDATLRIEGEMEGPSPQVKELDWRRAARDSFLFDAQIVLRALHSLPQGTLDQVLALLLRDRASLLVVAVERPQKLDLPQDPPPALRACMATIFEEWSKDREQRAGDQFRPGPVGVGGAAQAVWETLRLDLAKKILGEEE